MALCKTTARKLDEGLAALVIEQRLGLAPEPGSVSRADIARRAGVSEGTIANLEKLALAKVAIALRQTPDLPPHLYRAICRFLSHPSKP